MRALRGPPPAEPAVWTPTSTSTSTTPGLWMPPPGARHSRGPARVPRREREAVEEPRDAAQRVGDALWPMVRWLGARRGGGGWIVVALLFGLTAPIALLRTRAPVWVRLVASAAIFLVWLGVIMGES